ncbi:hypothetical protein [Nonomuraea longicatena]|uniref:Uncharacterized protein n=1 Tax=Nonomuraea longicatena TaxID=83682 RepID=A0ABN1QH74_9ACTN
MHWHAYTWNGNGQDLARESERRPTSPDFPTSPLPPMRTGDWLLKPLQIIAETFNDEAQAVAWMEQTYIPHRTASDKIPLEARALLAGDLLPRGVDVQWGVWLTGGRFLTVGVICCPNRHVSHPCPLTDRTGPVLGIGRR